MRDESKPWLWVAGAIVLASVLISGTLLIVNSDKQPDCSGWDRAVDGADQVWNSYVDAQIAKYGPVGGSATVASWEGDRGAIRALAAETGKVPSSPNPTDLALSVQLNKSGIEKGWSEDARPFAVRPDAC